MVGGRGALRSGHSILSCSVPGQLTGRGCTLQVCTTAEHEGKHSTEQDCFEIPYDILVVG